jgi:hypothetical protein
LLLYSVDKLTGYALNAALSLSDEVIAVSVPSRSRASTGVVICTIPYRLTTR